MKRRLRHSIIILCLLNTGLGLKAQHSGVISQYMFNGLLINPAYAGSKNFASININYRNQWTGFDGSPSSQAASFHMPVDKDHPLSFGAVLTREEAGIRSEIAARAIASYKIKLSEGHLRFGLGGGIATMNSYWSQAITQEEGDPLFQSDVRGVIRPMFTAGAYYHTRKLYVGYSIPSILTYDYPTLDKVNSSFSINSLEQIITAGYLYKINRHFDIKPSMLFRGSPSAGIQADINTNLIYRNKFWSGLSYRFGDAVVAMLEYQVHHQLRVGYAYDYTLSSIGRYSNGSHEVMLVWELRKQSFARTPRYF